jgi:imidazolonepropionase-like amidohydrolase
MRYVPRAQRERWHETFVRVSPNFTEPELRKVHYGMRSRIVGEEHRAGVRILAGTDTGAPYAIPGFSLHDELEALVEAGLSPTEALAAATIEPARFLGREEELGTVAAGKLADLVVLDADPLERIANTRRIAAVLADGRYLPRDELGRMLSELERAADADPAPPAPR